MKTAPGALLNAVLTLMVMLDGVATIEGVTLSAFQYQTTESPLVGLARRKDRDGKPFLSRELVAAGERLREDHELFEVGRGGVEI
ncbi:MAG: hypothetical protein ACJAVT_001308 [Yoonia sp.]|jgi:hypothetical protein